MGKAGYCAAMKALTTLAKLRATSGTAPTAASPPTRHGVATRGGQVPTDRPPPRAAPPEDTANAPAAARAEHPPEGCRPAAHVQLGEQEGEDDSGGVGVRPVEHPPARTNTQPRQKPSASPRSHSVPTGRLRLRTAMLYPSHSPLPGCPRPSLTLTAPAASSCRHRAC